MHGPSFAGTAVKSLSPATRVALALVPITWTMLVFGSTVRAHGAGLACPDWPLCFGEVVPQLDFGIALEFGHRVLGGVISLLYLALGLLVFLRSTPRHVRALWVVGAGLLTVQIVLGGLTVLELLAEWTVASHLIGGNAFSALLLVLALALWEADRPVVREGVSVAQRSWALRLGLLVLVQMALGGLVSSSHAGLACGTWPGCNGPEWFPTLQGLVGLQVMHRIAAYGVLGMALVNVLAARGRGRVGRAAWLVLGLTVAQVALGVANVLMLIPVELTIAHAGNAALIVLATAALNVEAWRAPVAAHDHGVDALPVPAK